MSSSPPSSVNVLAIELIVPDPHLPIPVELGKATLELITYDLRTRVFSLKISWLDLDERNREHTVECKLTTGENLRNDLSVLWIYTTDEEFSRTIVEVITLLAKKGMHPPS